MARFSLDYSPPRPSTPRRRRRPYRSPVWLLVSCLLVGGIGLSGTLVLASENQQIRRERDAYALRCDSLLAAKLQADRLLLKANRGLTPPPVGASRLSN